MDSRVEAWNTLMVHRLLMSCVWGLAILVAPASVHAHSAAVWQPTDYSASAADLWVTTSGAS